jgi:UDP-N-acetylmuramoyl-L-alanyl-D-glutamate--2,6-diaminopimelate ligase
MSGAISHGLGTKLSRLLAGFGEFSLRSDPIVTGLTLDSRTTRSGDCFFALSGTHGHGLRYLHDAIIRGAVAAVIDDASTVVHDVEIPIVVVPSLREKVGKIAARFFDHPSEQLWVIAVTGTNGKTTVAHLCAQALSRLHHPCGYVGTLGAGPLDALEPTGMTTPDPITLHGNFRKLLATGHKAVAMEASSHALDQSRLSGTAIEAAIFIGFGHDHLDYHKSLEAYADAKRKLFQQPGLRHAIVNVDDDLGRRIYDELDSSVTKWKCSLNASSLNQSDTHFVRAGRIEYRVDGTRVEVVTHLGTTTFDTQLVGDFNAHNLLLVMAVILALGFPLARASVTLATLEPVVGRLESFGATGALPRIYVDYAHSPDSLERVLKVLRGFAPARLYCVFGCGGNRDRSKRPVMGAIAERYCDHVYLTSDNPRDEAPGAIIDEILAGFNSVQNLTVIEDRAAAIAAALAGAAANDIVLIAGKGHETDQVIGARTVHLSDQETVQRWIRSHT